LVWTIKTEVPKLLPALQETINQQGEQTRQAALSAIDSQSNNISKLVSKELGEARKLVAAELNNTRNVLSSELALTRESADKIAVMSDSRLAAIQTDLNTQIDKIKTDLNTQLTAANFTLSNTLEPMTNIGKQFADAAPLFLDCDHNADCFFNRYVGAARAVENGSGSLASIANTADKYTKKLTEPKPWYKHFYDLAITTAIVAAKVSK
jgi:hypothetical protein